MKEIGLILFCTIMCLFFAACTKESNFQKGTHVDNKSSEQLYVEAGDYYLGLNGKEKNYKKAFSLLMQSAELGHSKAQTAAWPALLYKCDQAIKGLVRQPAWELLLQAALELSGLRLFQAH